MPRTDVLLGLFLLAGVVAAAVEAEAQRPNVLVLFADDQRADTVGALGNGLIRTPNLDQLARSGISFTSAYCMGSWHGAVCQPSRAMLHTGRTLWRVKPDMAGTETWGETFRAAGYDTFGIGKWHNGGKSFARSFAGGEAIMLGGMSNHFRVPLTPYATVAENKRGKLPAEDGIHSSELFAAAAVRYLERRAQQTAPKSPFFLYVAFTAPHDPRDAPPPYRRTYFPDRPPLPANFLPQHPFDNGELTTRDENLAPWPRTEEIVRDQLAEYYGLITHFDTQVGRVLAALEQSGERENTIIVYAADHGLALGSHGLLGKQSLYEHSMKAPLILVGPGVAKNARREALVYLLDVFPTVCALTGVEAPQSVEGKSLAPVIRGEREGVRHTLFTAYRNCQRAVRDARYKLIRYPLIDHTQLFDLAADPDERRNLAADPAHAATVARMMKELVRRQREFGDKAPLTVAKPRRKEIDLTGKRWKADRWQPKWIREKYFGDR